MFLFPLIELIIILVLLILCAYYSNEVVRLTIELDKEKSKNSIISADKPSSYIGLYNNKGREV